MYFSWSPRKVPKEGDSRGHSEKACPLKKPLRAHRQPVSKNVPIFEHLPLKILQVFSLQTPENRNIFGCRMAVRRGFPKGVVLRAANLQYP